MRLRITSRAAADLAGLWRHVASTDPVVADRVLARIDAGIRMLSRFPQAAPERPDIAPGLRAHPVRPWVILYRLDPEAVVVVRVLDGRRDPAGWAA